ncbi:3-hydroxyacyl-CoA dehydrogenase family protein [Paenibacillus sp. N1-5-1-14]|uniref:3-hydroxyacyl-CoA dehydrogenase family protein n=1 Tax=Paenibacillus radicibacter TaxID=2972488 RepID=UPI002159A8DC|nr:3-hydroxyacyl-CoA dehydrogenase family protein [Paenibacillus radicibacter]MCR8641818.1 3-hydroxyacyl-CoA dehydrogenase family protein [Paenibacillus radicibacter]
MATTPNVILLAGQGPLHVELQQLLESKHYDIITPHTYEQSPQAILLAIEVTNSDLSLKKTTLQHLDHLLDPDIPILTTSMAVSATEAASWVKHAGRICGFGSFIPLHERQLIEIAPALQTDSCWVELAANFFHTIGKNVAVVQDEVGLVFPRVLSLIINEAVFTVMEGTATISDIDLAMKNGTNYPYGPLEWADRIGLDEVLAVIQGLHRDLAEERYRPAPLLRKMVLAGRIGRGSGQGFYSYEPVYKGDEA